MNEDGVLRSLIRLIPPARSLQEETEKSLHLELYNGVGDMAVRSYQGLHASVSKLAADDPYVQGLAVKAPDGASDKEKVSLVLLAASQLLAYLEGQTGLPAAGVGGRSTYQIQTAPRIEFTDVEGVTSETLEKLIGAASKQVEGFKGKS